VIDESGGICDGLSFYWKTEHGLDGRITIVFEDEGFLVWLYLNNQPAVMGRTCSWNTPDRRLLGRLRELIVRADGYFRPPLGFLDPAPRS
jgi:hypothetical protein